MLGSVERDAVQSDGFAQVLLIQDVLEVDRNASELFIGKALVLGKGHRKYPNPTRADMLTIHLFSGVRSLIFVLKQDGSMASLSAAFQLTNLDGLADEGILAEELLDLLLSNLPGQFLYL